jgi:quercetin dioxygenase-like cupin family protein
MVAKEAAGVLVAEVRKELEMKKSRMIILLPVAVVLLATSVFTARIKRSEQTPALEQQFLVSLRPEEIQWKPVFDGVEMAVLSGDPTKAGASFVVRVKHRDGVKVPPHWHSFDENITVLSGTWVMGLGEKFDLSAAQEFPAGSYLVVPKNVPHFALCKGTTIVQGHGIGPLDTHFIP